MKVEIDYKNIILMDQLDSIHTFIFHSMRRRNTRRAFENIEFKYDNDENNDEKHEEEFIWSNKPKSISQCNIEQISWVINNVIFDKLKQKARDSLTPHKLNIITYVKERGCNGSKLKEMKRKPFLTEMLKYLQGDNQLKGPLGALYSAIMNTDISMLFENKEDEITGKILEEIWHNDEKEEEEQQFIGTDKPKSISQCNVTHIVWIINDHIFNKLKQKTR
eukprot:355951_1